MNFRPPGNEFAKTSYRWRGSGAAVKTCVGNAAISIGWIPAYQKREQMPEGCLHDQWDLDESIALLLSTGNPSPPEKFSGPADLVRYLNFNEFRAAIAIDAPTLEIDADGKPVLLEFFSFARVGCTAIRPGHFTQRLDWLTFYSGGVNESCGEVFVDANSVVIRLFVRAKLGFLGRLAARMKTGDWPPWATLTIEYVFDLKPLKTKVDFMGTSVPSQSRYVDWRKHSEYRIEYDMSEAAYEGFVRAGNCSDAPGYRTQVRSAIKILDGFSD